MLARMLRLGGTVVLVNTLALFVQSCGIRRQDYRHQPKGRQSVGGDGYSTAHSRLPKNPRLRRQRRWTNYDVDAERGARGRRHRGPQWRPGIERRRPLAVL